VTDQTSDVISFIWDKHPELDIETITKCVAAMSEWVAAETEKNHE
jgi:hypothetical protein